jgi:predicted aldo/keto reductase-like oxidoreductase
MDTNNNNINNIETKKLNRRSFLKAMGIGTAGVATAMVGCKPRNSVSAVEEIQGEMTLRTNPHTGDKVSLLGYGCMRFPLRTNAEGLEEIDQDITNDLIDYAMANGVNMYDTAPGYIRGWSETATGIALKRHPRESFFVSTKASNQRGPFGFDDCVAMYRKSLRDMQVDYIDYYHLHSVGASIESFHQRFIDNGFLKFLQNERAEGRIRNLGWSFHGNLETFDYVLAYENIQWDFAMITLNYPNWINGDNKYLYDECTKKNVPCFVMAPIQGGRLSRVSREAFNLMAAVNPGDSPSRWALRFAGTPKNILTVLSGMGQMEQLEENVRTFSPLIPMNEREYEVINRVTEIITSSDYIQCTYCQYCMPCPYGIDIPETFGHFNRSVSAGNVLQHSNDPNDRRARRQFLIGYDRRVERMRQAKNCIECGICNPKCPQRIDIPKALRRVDDYAENLRQNLPFGEEE